MIPLLSLFLTSFLAGSFLPVVSEVHLLYLQNQGVNNWLLLMVAGLGNTLGGMSCYAIARWGGRPAVKKFLRFGDAKISYWENRLQGKAEWVAVLGWLPFIGECLCAALGFVSKKTYTIFFYMFLGKLLRYVGVLFLGTQLEEWGIL